MPETVTNELIYSVSQKMQADLSEVKLDVRDMKTRVTMVEEHLGGALIAISGVHARIDRISDRAERIERRLELADHG